MAPVLSEDFSTSDGGWTVNGDARNFAHVPQSGATGGYITADDGVQGITWNYVGGAAFTGDLSAYAGGTLSYAIRQTADTSQFDDVDVLIVGGGRTIALDFPVEDNPGTDFTDYVVDLTSAQGWFDTTTQAVLTDAEILSVLEDVQSLRIRGEYREGSDTSELDFVTLTSEDEGGGLPGTGPLPVRDGFATGADGWRITADGQDAIWQPEGGKTNGYLQASDRPSGDTWYFKTPEGFAGNYSDYAGGTLNYALFQTALSSQFDSNEDVRLIAGDGQILAVDLPEDTQPGLDWTDYTIDLTEMGGWYDTVTDQIVTDSEVAAVLANLDSIEIRGEYRIGSDTAGLDDFALLGQGQLIEDFANPGGNGDDALTGTDGDDTFDGFAGADTFTPGGGNDTVDGGADTDTVLLEGARDDYTVQITPDAVIVTDRTEGRDGIDTLIDVERITFEGATTDPVLDLTVFADFATLEQTDFTTFVEMYIAYFNRAPDALGLYFWGTVLAKGDLTLEQIAADFFNQPETQAAYPDLSNNTAFASQVYQNVLGREFDQAGLDFWVGLLDAGDVTKEQFILDLLAGVDAVPEPGSDPDFIAQKQADAAYLANKTDLGVYFSVQLGMSDVNDAIDTMAIFDGSEASITAARAAIDADYAEALDPASGDFLMQLVGVFDDIGV